MKGYGYFFYSVFIVILLIPFYGLIEGIDYGKGCENRSLLDSLAFENTDQYLDDFDTYFKDQLGFKNALTNFNANFKYYVFQSSSHPKKAVIGKDNWIFYTDKNSKALNSFARSNLFSSEKLHAKTLEWETRKDSLQQLGAKYYMSIYPNKSTVYTESLPFNLRILKKDTISRVDQVINHLSNKNSNLQILDIRPKINSIKDSINLYFRFDSHWNDIGCFLAYQELCKKMDIEPYRFSDFIVDSISFSQGDLGRVSGLCLSTATEEIIPRLKLKNEIDYGPQKTTEYGAYYWTNSDTTLKKRIVVFRDSYTNPMVQWLALHFKDGYYISSPFNYEVIHRLKPDIVLVASVERYFGD